MRLLNITRSVDPARGGVSEGLRQSVAATATLGVHEEVVTLDAAGPPWLDAFPAPVHPLGPVRSNYGYSERLVPWLRQNVKAYDAVLVHGLWQYQGLAAWRVLHAGPVPYFVYPHGMLDPWFTDHYPLKHLKKRIYWSWAERLVLRDAAAVLFTADEEARRAALSFPKYQVRPAVVGHGIALGADSRAGHAEEFLEKWPATRGRRIVLFLGRIHAKKGCDLLIDAFASVAREEPRLHLVMAGPEDSTKLRQTLVERVAHHGLAERVTWTGMLTGTDKWSALHAAEVFALPSHQENFGLAVVEALALGLPVLISDKVNIWREIIDAGAGFVGNDDLVGTTTSLRRWLALGREQRVAMQQAAVRCYRTNFDAAATAERLIEAIVPHTRGASLFCETERIHGGATKPT